MMKSVQGLFYRLHHICGMASLLEGSQQHLMDGLQHLIKFGGQGLGQAPQKFTGCEAVVAAGWDRLLAEELRRPALNFRKRLTLCI